MVGFESRKRIGFTLIELLVVVAIIALLISILLPSLTQARQVARTVQCQSVMRQFSLANQMYADAYEQFFVPIKTADVPGPWISWTGFEPFRRMLSSSGGWAQELQCADRLSIYRDKQQWGLGYGFNYSDIGIAYANALSIHRSRIPGPAGKAQLTESNYWRQLSRGANPVGNWDTYGELMPAEGGKYPTVAYRHLEQTNIAFFDGHVSALSKQEAYPASSTARATLWNLRAK